MFYPKTNNATDRKIRRTEVKPHRHSQSFFKKAGLGALIAFFVLFSFLFVKVEKTFSLINNRWRKKIIHVDNYQEKNRLDILILGLRGKDDIENGGYLTDTILIASIDTEKERLALLSVPRDLYVRIPRINKIDKINSAYAYGKSNGGDGLTMSRLAVEEVTGINIDYTAAVDFSAFKELIDDLGGIDVYVPHEFVESSQWGWEFRVPKGMNHMNSETALYYARSRYSTSDFDRSRRQQDIIAAIGKKVLTLKVLSNPIKLNSILNSLSEGIDTDIDFVSLFNLIKYSDLLENGDAIKFILDNSPDNFLTAADVNGAYALYPKAGAENYDAIKEKFRNIFANDQI